MKIKNIKALEKFSRLYADYIILEYDKSNFTKDDFLANHKLLMSSFKNFSELAEEFDDTTPTTLISMQAVTEGFTTEERYIEVQLNLKKWQKVAYLSDSDKTLRSVLRIFTGFDESKL